jgi:protein-tyrosine phosphatase
LAATAGGGTVGAVTPPVRILAVCLGNICRSPTAEAAIREAALRAGVAVEVEPAGTGPWHVGEPADPRMREAAATVGLTIDGTARQVNEADFEDFDLIVAMDSRNHADLVSVAPPGAIDRIRLFRTFDPDATDLDVPDPYYGGDQGFIDVVEMVRAAAAGLIGSLEDR